MTRPFLTWIVLSIMCITPVLSYGSGRDGDMKSGGIKTRAAVKKQKPEITDTEVLVRFKEGVSKDTVDALNKKLNVKLLRSFRKVSKLYHVKISDSDSMKTVLAAYQNDPDVRYAEPNYIYHIQMIPNDPFFSSLWSLNNLGQTGGSVDSDVNAPEAWNITTGSAETVIAIIDTGVDYNHPDLSANIWANPGEIPGNGIDDDNNGYIDDIHGINAITGSGDPLDDHGHGTHVAGIIAASGNNSIGIAGMNWTVKLVACKFLDSGGYGSLSSALGCMDYLHELKTRSGNPVTIIATNNSWGGLGYSLAFADALEEHKNAGILFVAAAGNNARDNDTYPNLPSNYPNPNVIAVAATDPNDQLADFSNYGRISVDVTAPGVDIMSTTLNNTYTTWSGTSMATPHVTGLVGLLKAQDTSRDWRTIKNLIVTGGQTVPGAAQTLSGKRIRAADENGVGSMTCNNQVLTKKWSPLVSEMTISLTGSVCLQELNINCGSSNGDMTVTIKGSPFTLRDDGAGCDQEAGDGIASGLWAAPPEEGDYPVEFPNEMPLTIHVMDIQGYLPAVETAYQPETFTGTGLWLSDDMVVAVDSPFPILFGGRPFTRLWVSDNGTVSLTDAFTYPANQSLPTRLVGTLVAPLWHDLVTDFGVVTWAVIGNAPNRKLVIRWNLPSVWGGYYVLDFQAVFFENSSDILFNYTEVNCGVFYCNGGYNATVGVQVSSDKAQQYSFGTVSLRNNMSLLYKLDAFAANGGPDQTVLPNAAVMLDGSGSSSPGGTIVSYNWIQTAGTPVSLTNANTATPRFTAPGTSGTLTFELTVTNNSGQTSSDSVNVVVNVPPIANAGTDQSVRYRKTVTLNGTASSDPDGTIVSYHWIQTAGTTVVLTGPNTSKPTFTAPSTAQTMKFKLTVTDNRGQSSSDTVNITVKR